MPKKTLALISGLVLVTVVLFVIALRSSYISVPGSVPTQKVVTPTPSNAHSVLILTPNPLIVLPGGVGKANVNIDTSDNLVTAVQLEISYDPKVLKNVSVVPGELFQKGIVIINKNDPVTGKLTYAIGNSSSQQTIKGIGTVATISFTASNLSSSSQLTLLPSTLVTARGVAESVLKTSSGTKIIVGSSEVTLPPVQASPSAGL